MIDKLKIAVGATLFCASLVSLAILAQYGAFDWAFTPNGKGAIAGGLFLFLLFALAVWALRLGRDRQVREESEELAAIDVWLPTLTGEMPAVRTISRAEMDAAAEDLDRWQEEMLTNVEAALPESWRRLTPAELDYAPVYVPPPPPEPEYVPAVVRWDPLQRAEESYAGRAAWFANDLRAGVPVYDEQAEAERVIATLSSTTASRPLLPVLGAPARTFIDAPVSPAAPPNYRPRHDADAPRPLAHVIGYDRAALRVLNEATGAFPLVPLGRELAVTTS